MSVSVEQVATFIGISAGEPLLPALLSYADAAVSAYLRPSGERRIPESVRDHAVKVLTSEEWTARNSPGGVASWSQDGTTPFRIRSDRMASVRPMLAPYRGPGGIG